LAACAQLSWFGGDVNRAREACRESLAAAESMGDQWGCAWSALGLAAVDMFKGEDDGVPIKVDEVLPLFRALGNDWDTGQALQTLGGAAWHRGLYQLAEKVFSETVALYRSLGHPTLMAALRDHGLMVALLGHLDAGAAEVEGSIGTAYEAGDLAGLAQGLCRRGAIARYGGHNEHARRYYRDALSAARDAGEAWSMQWALDGLGSTEEVDVRVPAELLEVSVEFLARAEVLSRETGISLAPREREFHAQDLVRARRGLGEEAFSAAFRRGERLSLNEAIDLALGREELATPVG
jgi:tetratricopeptide (TPR) repeat protein